MYVCICMYKRDGGCVSYISVFFISGLAFVNQNILVRPFVLTLFGNFLGPSGDSFQLLVNGLWSV